MQLVAWNVTPQCATESSGLVGCPSAKWFWIALGLVGLAAFMRRRKGT